MKFCLLSLALGTLASTAAFANGEVVCASGDANNWADVSVINNRVAQLQKDGKNVTVSAPSMVIDTRAQGSDRLCVTLTY